jgi:GNAT superfamily N-acetyltransferase
MGETRTTATGTTVELSLATPGDHDEIFALFREVVGAGEGYPHHPDRPVTWEDFDEHWLAPAVNQGVARIEGALAGSWTLKPNGVGRAAHVANAGFVVDRRFRGRGVGEVLVRHCMDTAVARGFDAMQFNFVFASNPARRLYERLGFLEVGRVPRVIDGEDVVIYWREIP